MADIRFQDKKIYYNSTGTGPAVILLHGFGENGNVFAKQIDFLKSHYHLVIPDLPGSGRSEPLEGNVTLADFADLIFAIAKKEFPNEKFSLFGHSMGGYTTMAFVEKYGDRLSTFGLIHSSSFADTPEKIEARRKSIGFIQKNGGNAFLKTTIPDLFSDESKKQHPSYIDQLLKLTSGISDGTLIQYYEAMINRPDRSRVLQQTDLPVLFIIGKYDQAVPFEISLQQCHLPAISSVHVLEHSGHMGMWEEPEKTNSALREFLATFV